MPSHQQHDISAYSQHKIQNLKQYVI